MDFKIINIPQKGESHFFHINSANRTIIGSKMSEFVQEKIVELSLVEKTEDSIIFKYNLKAQKMQGSATIHRWTSDMDNLQANLIIVTDLAGNLIDILNFEDLYRKWKEKYLQMLKTKYADFQPGLDVMIAETSKSLQNKEQFIKSFAGYSSWHFFFQSWYKKHSTEEKSSMVLNGYFGKIDLPLITSTTSIFSENTTSMQRTAELNEKEFDRKGFARMLKDLTNIYNIDATLKVDMEERYEINDDGWLHEAELFLETSVNNWYSISTAHQLKQLSTDEYEAFIEEISPNKMSKN